MITEKEKLWQSVLAQVQLNTSEANFNTWFKGTQIYSLEDPKIIIAVPNSFVKEWLENKYNKIILKTIKELNNNIKEINYIIKTPSKKEVEREEKIGPINQMQFQEFSVDSSTGLNPKYTFENFVVGPFNELAHAASFAVSESPGTIYNPLFIYGKTGLGKTHLLQAVGNEIKNKIKNKNILYIQAQKFISEVVSSIRNGKMEEFKNQYKDIDIIIIDDIQFLSGKEKTQEEFFHIFNELYEKNKQIILSSDRPPKSINALTDRLRSRFEGGMITDIDYPDLETRAAILKKKAIEKEFNLSDDVCSYIVENIQKNIRELEGVLNKLIIHQKVHKEDINMDRIKIVLKNIIQSSTTSFSSQNIFKVVSDYYEINEKEIKSSSRKREIVKPRQIIIYLLRNELNYSFPYIGKKIGGKDHTTIIYSFNKINKDLKINEDLREEISYIKQTISSM